LRQPRILVLVVGIATAVAAGPALGPAALAADPTVVVRPGDTLTAISRRVNVPMTDLVRLNQLSDANRIVAGQTLRIGIEAPAPAPAPVAASAPSAAPVAAPPGVHVVQRGENLTTIARRYRTTVSAIVAANAIANPSRIYGGQTLTIPGAAAPVAPTPPTPVPPPAAPPAGVAMPPSMAAAVAARDGVRQVIAEEAARFGVPVPLALAVAWQESGWRQEVVSRAGAVGVMQLMPATAVWVGEAMLGTSVDINDTRANVRAGVRLLGHYLGRYGGNRDLVLAAYYQGQRATDLHGVYAVSRPYIASVAALERLFGG